MSRYSEFDRNLQGIAKAIGSLRAAVGPMGAMPHGDEKKINEALARLVEIHQRWKQHADFFAVRPGVKFSMPMDWDNDKASRYDATMIIQHILESHQRPAP